MSNQLNELEVYKKNREKKAQESQEYFKDVTYNKGIEAIEKLKETKESNSIKEIPINTLGIMKIARKIKK